MKKTSNCFGSAKKWLNLIFRLTYTNPIFYCEQYIFWPIIKNGPQAAFLIIFVLFLKLSMPCKLLCLGCLLIFFFPNLLLLNDGLDLVELLLAFHGCRIIQRNQFSFHQTYLYYLESFPKGNSLLWV